MWLSPHGTKPVVTAMPGVSETTGNLAHVLGDLVGRKGGPLDI